MPTWIEMIITMEELDVAPETPQHAPPETRTRAELITALQLAASTGHEALATTTDEHLMTPWRMLARGEVVSTASRLDQVRDMFLHMAHHRGQLTVYLRLLDAKVPALYGPSADDARFD
jgi:uncharacterized damage-inducible protein DinB